MSLLGRRHIRWRWAPGRILTLSDRFGMARRNISDLITDSRPRFSSQGLKTLLRWRLGALKTRTT
jgi:hypothetical protein